MLVCDITTPDSITVSEDKSDRDANRLLVQYLNEVCGKVIRSEHASEHCSKCGADSTYVHALQAPGM